MTPLVDRLRALAYTTVEDCLGVTGTAFSHQWCVYDAEEDDPPLPVTQIVRWFNEAADEIENLATTVKEDLAYQRKLEARIKELEGQVAALKPLAHLTILRNPSEFTESERGES